jgi:hypothetical protein
VVEMKEVKICVIPCLKPVKSCLKASVKQCLKPCLKSISKYKPLSDKTTYHDYFADIRDEEREDYNDIVRKLHNITHESIHHIHNILKNHCKLIYKFRRPNAMTTYTYYHILKVLYDIDINDTDDDLFNMYKKIINYDHDKEEINNIYQEKKK